jgi:hypothetical protein
MCVRWASCGHRAVSIGGKDRTVFLWHVAPAHQAPIQHPLTPPWAPDPGVEAGCFWKPSPVPNQSRRLHSAHAVPSGQKQGAWK